MPANTTLIIDEIEPSPEAEWFWYQPSNAFRPLGLVVWGGRLIKSFKVGNVENLMGDIPAMEFGTTHSFEALKEYARVGMLLRVLNRPQLHLPSLSPASRITLQITGNPTKVAVYGLLLS